MARRRDQIVLAVLLLVLAGVGYRAWRSTAAPRRSASNPSAAGRRADASPATLTAPDVHLQALNATAPAVEPAGRDLFRFGAPPAPDPTPRAALPAPVPGPGSRPTDAAAPEGVAPIPLKFIGVVEGSDSNARIAVLSDGRGAPLYGREGDAIAGRYRILHIGTESVEMAYLDGRGRQTIRLSGS